MTKIAVNICRFILAATFLFSGFIKANDPLGTVYKLNDYLSAWSITQVPDMCVLITAILLAAVEFTLGAHLLIGIRRKETSNVVLMFMTAFTILTVYIFIYNPVSDCGCFGDAIILTNGETLAKNIILLAMAVFTWKYSSLQYKFVSENIKWLLSLLSTLFAIGLSIYSIYALPALDFRPYSVGSDMRMEAIAEEMSAASERNDSRALRLATARADFYIEDAETGDDITEDITEHDGYTMLLIIPDLTNADESYIDRINTIYDYCTESGHEFWCITGTTDAELQTYWCEHTGADYKLATADERVLKTIVRANPGLVLLHNGVIMKKWSNWQLPHDEQLYNIFTETTN